MASGGLLALPAGIALALGANIGTAVTTGLMGFLSSKSTEAVRASVVHVLFNVVGVVLWLPFIGLLTDIAIWISPSSPGLEGTARAAAEVPRQIANANTFFNVANTLLFIGFTGWFAAMAQRLVPKRAPEAGVLIEPEFLNEAALAAPAVALQQVRLELGRIGDIALSMLKDVAPALKKRDLRLFEEIVRRDDEIDILEAEILKYLGRLREEALTEEQSVEFQGLVAATDNLENLGDVIETDAFALAQKLVDIKSVSGEETRKLLQHFHATVVSAVELAVQAIRDNDQQAA